MGSRLAAETVDETAKSFASMIAGDCGKKTIFPFLLIIQISSRAVFGSVVAFVLLRPFATLPRWRCRS